MRLTTRRRWLAGLLAGAAMTAALACTAVPLPTTSTPVPTAPAPAPTAPTKANPAASPQAQADGRGHLVAFDYQASKIHVYALPEMRLTGSLENVGFDNHMGTVTLSDGRVLFSSRASGEVMALRVDGQGRPTIDLRVKAELPEGGVWGQVDPSFRYFAVTSGYEDDRQVMNIVDLQERRNTVLPVTMKEKEELHPWLTGNPGLVVAGVGGELQAFRFDDVLRGNASAVQSARVGLGSHGPVIAPALQKILMTSAEGLAQVSYSNGQLVAGRPIPWDVDGRSTGRNARPRLSWDGNYVYGAVAATQPAGADRWAERPVDIHVANLREGTARRLPLDRGIAYRFQISRPYAFFAVRSPEGDAAYLFDVLAGSPTFQTVIARIPLPALKDGPVPGESASGKQGRSLAITPDGRYAFVAQGGESSIVVIDTQSRQVIRTLDVPSAMGAGGYLVAVQPGTAPVDLQAR